MKYEVRIDNARHLVECSRSIDGVAHFQVDGNPVPADVVEVRKNEYSILINGRSLLIRLRSHPEGMRARCEDKDFAVTVVDPRSRRGTSGKVPSTEGRQQVTAPMPGKVVRVLVSVGDTVEAGHGLVVVEAMKMQNEIRSLKKGKVERLLVRADQTVAAGEILVIVA